MTEKSASAMIGQIRSLRLPLGNYGHGHIVRARAHVWTCVCVALCACLSVRASFRLYVSTYFENRVARLLSIHRRHTYIQCIRQSGHSDTFEMRAHQCSFDFFLHYSQHTHIIFFSVCVYMFQLNIHVCALACVLAHLFPRVCRRAHAFRSVRACERIYAPVLLARVSCHRYSIV